MIWLDTIMNYSLYVCEVAVLDVTIVYLACFDFFDSRHVRCGSYCPFLLLLLITVLSISIMGGLLLTTHISFLLPSLQHPRKINKHYNYHNADGGIESEIMSFLKSPNEVMVVAMFEKRAH